MKPEPGTEEYLYEEGCLSFPKIRGDVPRPGKYPLGANMTAAHGFHMNMACEFKRYL